MNTMTTSASSLTEALQRSSINAGKSPLFSIGDRQYLSYNTSWDILHRHKKWIHNKIISCVRDDAWKNDEHDVASSSPSQPFENNIVIGYLADNSPDLLLSMLGCIDLTHCTGNKNSSDKCDALSPLPAMINVRWTPLEIQRALRVRTNETVKKRKQAIDERQRHVTILLYSQGYEETARQAVHLMNADKVDQHQFSVAIPLPLFANDKNNTPDHSPHYFDQSNRTEMISDLDALILFTSGTSSPNGAKGVRLSHRSLFIQAHAKTCPPCNYDSHSRVVATTVPWFHVGGISSALAVVLGGGCLVFPSDEENQIGSATARRKGFQPDVVLRSLQPKEGAASASLAANTLVVVPAMLHAMFELQQKQQQKFRPNHNVRLILVGGQSIGDRLYQLTRQFFPKARIVQTYACTEAGSSITFLDLGYSSSTSVGAATHAGLEQETKVDGATLVGSPPQHIEIEIFDEKSDMNNLIPLPKGQMGIIGTRGPHVMSGYWGDETLQVGEWMLTNDLGYIVNQNDLYFCGRANDVIRTGGESVLATEVEKVIIIHPNVDECAIFALPDDKFGDVVCAAIVLKGGSTAMNENKAVEEDDQLRILMRKHCQQHQLAGFKRPRRVFRMHSLPRNSSGKVLKYEIVKSCATRTSNRSRL